MDKVKNLGQVFTPSVMVKSMVDMVQHNGSMLEPSCGDGAFTDYIQNVIGRDITSIEIDPDNYRPGFVIMDFFDLITDEKYDTIIGNPPYVAYKRLSPETLQKIHNIDYLRSYPSRTNLYIYFIRKCLEHLTSNGELIFVTPREFIKSTSSIKLNELLYESGTITDWYEYGDQVVFKGYSPNIVVWRFEKGNFSRKTRTNNGIKNFKISHGQLLFLDKDYDVKFSDLFFVKVGAVSGMDKIYVSELGNQEFVCSYTKTNDVLKRMIYNVKHPILEEYKDELINRGIKPFNEGNWWMWGRGLYESDSDRIYVNCKTRDTKPFFTHECKYYDGSVLAIFPKRNIDINKSIELLNNVDWDELGFLVGGRLCFSQKSLENSYLPHEFSEILK
jgi:adenine-specific DNA-methyltransferase